MAQWVLQCNPNRWRIFDFYRDKPKEVWSNFDWSVTTHLHEITQGDRAAFWISGSPSIRGVYAIGTVSGQPHEGGGFNEYATDPEDRRRKFWYVPLSFDLLLFANHISVEDLSQDERFKNALVLRMPHTSNPIPLTPQEWLAIEELARERS